MAYCTAAELQAANPKRTYSTTSTPTLTQVGEFIDQIYGEIETVLLGRSLPTPITSPATFVDFLKKLNLVGAIAMCENAMFPDFAGQLAGSAADRYWKQYQDGLKFLREGELPVDSGATAPLPFSFFSDNSGNSSEPVETHEWQKPKFGKNKDF